MINLLIGSYAPPQQDIINLIDKPPAIVEQVKELTIDQKIKSNFYKCNTDIQWIRADNAQCLDKQVVTPVVATNPLEPIKKTAQRTSSVGGYTAGQCTALVASMRYVPGGWGNASNWKYAAQSQGWTVSSTPVPGAIGWTPGHVVYVNSVHGNTVTITEANYDWRGSVRTIDFPISKYVYLY